jgi:Flp pilus assembly protein TadG
MTGKWIKGLSFRRFRNDRSGNVAVIFALSLIPLFGVGGAALDYSRVLTLRSKLQHASDAAALAASHGARVSVAAMNDLADKSFKENLANVHFAKHVSMKVTKIKNGVRVTADGRMETSLLGVLGISKLDVHVASEVGYSNTKLEVALVLDNTGSMSGSKLATLKSSSKLLVDTLIPDSSVKNVKIALVPFSKYVNVGLGNRNEAGLDIPADYSVPRPPHCYNTYPNSTRKCDKRKVPGTCWNDGVSYPCMKTEYYNCTGDRGDPVKVCKGPSLRKYKWDGCVGSRNYPLIVKDTTYSTGVPGLLGTWDWCYASPITRLTKNKTTIEAGLSSMNSRDKTYIPAGLMWGWRLISPSIPFADGTAYTDKQTKKVIILMTDGANTKSPSYPKHDKTDIVKANQLTKELCTNIAAKDIRIYTIAFQVTDATIKSLLQTCAVNGGYYVSAASNSALKQAFEDIAESLIKLRLTK